MSVEIITAAHFWDLYFENRFLGLQRDPEIVIGNIEYGEQPSTLLRSARRQVVGIKRETLKKHAYSDDGRFSLMRASGAPRELIPQIMNQSYAYRDPAPFGKLRMSEVSSEACRHFGWAQPRLITANDLIDATRSVVANFSDKDAQLLNTLAWLLGECREPMGSTILLTIVERAKHVGHTEPILFGIVDTALEALWKINDKSILVPLVSLMERADDTGKHKFAALFKRLLSTNRLLSLDYLHDEYVSPQYWGKFLAPYSSYDVQKWSVFDTNSLFWEIRYLAASRLPSKHDALRNLMDDEVSLVAELAATRLR